MGRGNLFWGVILIIGGSLLLLDNLGLLNVNVWSLIWPLFLIGLGVRALWGAVAARQSPRDEQAAIPLEGAASARVRVHHGAGRLDIHSGAGPDELAAGTFGGGLDYRARRAGETLEVDMHVRESFTFPWMWGPGRSLDWSFGLNSGIPLSLELKTGASESRLELADLRVTDLRLETGASATRITLPANAGRTRAEIRAGAASVELQVPPGVAARIRIRGGLSSANVDAARFPRMGDVYQSQDYHTAANTADIDIETGVGSVRIY